jgi:hypothetical protein
VQQPTTPTINRWTRDEVRLRKKERKKERKVHDVCKDDTVTPQLQGHVLLRSAEKFSWVPGRKFDEFVKVRRPKKKQLLSFLKFNYFQFLIEIRDLSTFRCAPYIIFII